MKQSAIALLCVSLLSSTCVLAGCESTAWTVVRQTQPNPLLDQRNWVVEPLSFDGAIVDGEPIGVYLSSRDQARRMGDPRFQRDLRTDLVRMNEAFVWRLVSEAGPLHFTPSMTASSADTRAFRIRAIIHGISTGQPRGYPSFGSSNALAQAFLTLTLLDPEGRELDVVDLQTELQPDAPPMTSAGPFGECGATIAEIAVGYLATRVDTMTR